MADFQIVIGTEDNSVNFVYGVATVYVDMVSDYKEDLEKGSVRKNIVETNVGLI